MKDLGPKAHNGEMTETSIQQNICAVPLIAVADPGLARGIGANHKSGSANLVFG